jgi:hypothetical protein
MPHPVGRPGENRKLAALSRIKVRPSQLEDAAPITEILKDVTKGIPLAFKAMRSSQSPIIRKFLHKWNRISEKDRIGLPLEAVAIAAKIDTSTLLGEIMLAMREHSVNLVKIVAVASHPDVMKKTVESALGDKGYQDRELIHNMLGASSKQQGTTFINKFFAGRQTDPDQPEDAVPVAQAEMVDDLEFIFPSSSNMQERIQPVRNRLLAGK